MQVKTLSLPTQGAGGLVVVAVVGGLLDEDHVVGGGDLGVPAVQPEPPPSRRLHPGGALVLVPQIVAWVTTVLALELQTNHRQSFHNHGKGPSPGFHI